MAFNFSDVLKKKWETKYKNDITGKIILIFIAF